MSIFNKPVFVLSILFLILSCGGSDDEPSVVITNDGPVGQDDGLPVNSTQTVQLSLDGVTGLDFGSLDVVSLNNTVNE